MKLIRRGEGRAGFEVKIHRIAAEGNAVLTERTDALIIGPLRLQFWVCGVFEVHAGRVTLWRDYFDMWDFTKATLRGVAATVFPSLRPNFSAYRLWRRSRWLTASGKIRKLVAFLKTSRTTVAVHPATAMVDGCPIRCRTGFARTSPARARRSG